VVTYVNGRVTLHGNRPQRGTKLFLGTNKMADNLT